MIQELTDLKNRFEALAQVLPNNGEHNNAVIETYKHCALMVQKELSKCTLNMIEDNGKAVQKISFNGVLIAEISSKQDWVNRVPDCLPEKTKAEQRIWIDANGNCLSIGEDFSATEIMGAYPVKVYKQVRSADVKNAQIIEVANNGI
jgi:hypothetical protein